MAYASDEIVPRRIFLDTGVFQAVADCGGYIFGEEPLPKIDEFRFGKAPQALKRPDYKQILESLRAIFIFNDRANFDWVVSSTSLVEIDAAGDASRSRYARDILDHTETCLTDNPPTEAATLLSKVLEGPSFGNISAKDLRLLVDAAKAEGDTFLTIEKKLPKQANVILNRVPLFVATPMTLWEKLRPHIRGL